MDANDAAVEQLRDLIVRLAAPGCAALLVFDAGYGLVKLQRGLEGHRAHFLMRLHSNRTFHAAPAGSNFALLHPETWTPASTERRYQDEDYGSMRVKAWSGLHPKTRRKGERYGCERAPVVRGSVILVEVGKHSARPASRSTVALVLRRRGAGLGNAHRPC